MVDNRNTAISNDPKALKASNLHGLEVHTSAP